MGIPREQDNKKFLDQRKVTVEGSRSAVVSSLIGKVERRPLVEKLRNRRESWGGDSLNAEDEIWKKTGGRASRKRESFPGKRDMSMKQKISGWGGTRGQEVKAGTTT